ncbi:hypothetical protein TSOC_010984 [Tetrabaena socialis]|uniref:Primase C-terminal 2 domain-containing protein n=1 Tax=Tetrabaena socialis TaxID=47790 RepID=A0A2J7ZRU8_9CHLO|nr:hypothetical protein TSOC_010984 [Tetrabaena socialis]|eukprot:PNH03001.1 hypothetical protein TSOC_010984 [Tetrabaena socialis]
MRHEFLSSRVETRLYLDYDEVLESPLTPEILKDRKDKVIARLDALLGPFSEDKTIVYYSIASRHGFSPRHGKFKVSFRPFVRGLSIPYTEIPLLLRSMHQDDFWDMSVYKEGEQLLAAINGVKDRDDPRVLTKEHADDPDAWYVAQILDDNALPFHMPLELGHSTTSPTTSSTRESNVDAVLVRDVLACLSSERFRDYASWRTVGFALKSLGDDVYLQEFQEFSRIPEYDSTAAQKACRELFERASTNGVTFGTLRHWAKEDDAEGYQRACAAYRMRSESSIVDRVTDDKILDAARILYTKLTLQPAPIASVLRHNVMKSRGHEVFDVHVLLDDATEGHMTMALDTLHVRGVFHGGTFEKYLNDSEATAIPVVGVEIASVHKDLPPDLQWRIMRPTGTRAVFSTENNRAMIEVLNVNSPGKETANVKFDLKTAAIKKGQVSLLNDAYKRAIEHSVVNDMNMGWAINIGIGTVNIYNNNKDENVPGRRPDDDLALLVTQKHPKEFARIVFAPDVKSSNCNGLYYCDEATNVWSQKHNGIMEEKIITLFKSGSQSGSMDLTEKEMHYVLSRRGSADMLHIVARKLADENFKDLLDSNRDIFPVANGCFDTSIVPGRVTWRALTLEDRVSVVAPWTYCPELAREKRAEVDKFLAEVLPLAEERSVVLTFFANLMSGKRCAKKFLVMTDKSGGDNGKSTLLALFSLFFASFSETNTKFVCKGSFDRDRDSHDAGMEPMKSKRLIVAEELKHDMTLDDALLKRLSGGDSVTISGRQCGSGNRFQFTWQAGVVMLFNEGDCPKFDAGDTAFMQRMLVAPMRAKFVDSGFIGESEYPHQFPMVANIHDKFPSWLPALADVFKDHYAPLELFNSVPPSMKEWRQEITKDANPLKEWLEREVQITGHRDDVLLVADLKRMYGVNERRFVEYIKAFFKGSDGVVFVEKCHLKVDGAWESKRGVIRGVTHRSV